jgi:dTMP kinase
MFPRTRNFAFLFSKGTVSGRSYPSALREGKIVISDRYSDSTLAYQGFGHGFDQQTLKQLLNFATGNLWPDLTFLLDIRLRKASAQNLK